MCAVRGAPAHQAGNAAPVRARDGRQGGGVAARATACTRSVAHRAPSHPRARSRARARVRAQRGGGSLQEGRPRTRAQPPALARAPRVCWEPRALCEHTRVRGGRAAPWRIAWPPRSSSPWRQQRRAQPRNRTRAKRTLPTAAARVSPPVAGGQWAGATTAAFTHPRTFRATR